MKEKTIMGAFSMFAVLAGMAVILLVTCYPPRRIAREYVLPQLMSDNFISFYPPEAYEKQLEGTVVLRIRVEGNGYVGQAEVFESSGYDILDNAALAMARTVRFEPGRVNGKVRDLWMTWPVVFDLRSTSVPAFNLVEWQRVALEFQAAASSENSLKQRIAQNSLFNHYLNLGEKMAENRSIFPNRAIMKVVASPLQDSWIEYQDVWPMAFVLFQDYTDRFPDSRNVPGAESYLVNYIVNEVSLLKKASTDGSPLAQTRQRLLNSLTRFLENNYPEATKQNPT